MENVAFISDAIQVTVAGSYCGLLWILNRNQTRRRLPVFHAYVLSQLLRALVLAVVLKAGWQAAYYYAYWALELASEGLALLVLREAFVSLLAHHERLQRLGMRAWQVALAVLLMIAAAQSAYAATVNQIPLTRFILGFQQGVHIMQAGLICLALFFAGVFALPWRSHQFGILAGFGFYAAVNLAATGVTSFFYNQPPAWYVLLKPAAYMVTTFIWLFYVLVTVRTSRGVVAAPADMELERWNLALLRLGDR